VLKKNKKKKTVKKKKVAAQCFTVECNKTLILFVYVAIITRSLAFSMPQENDIWFYARLL
jgi:hypothetical protein